MRIDELDDTVSQDAPDATDAVRDLYRAHGADVHAYLDRRVGRDLADDLLADTFRIAIERWSSYDRTVGSARNWLYGIATNLVRRHWRTTRRRQLALDRLGGTPPVGDDPTNDPARTAAGRVDANADVRRLLEAVAALDAADHDLLTLTAWESMTSSDVAEVLGIPKGTVRSRLHRIRRQLDAARRAPNPRPDLKGDGR